jgi:hypothetical protein
MGAIAKAGDIHARNQLNEAATSYRFPARIARHTLTAVHTVPEAVRVITWKAKTRLCRRYRHVMVKRKLKQIMAWCAERPRRRPYRCPGDVGSRPSWRTRGGACWTRRPPTRSTLSHRGSP